uniref:Uncharacterized protein n=1 Tax=Anguilla anguilla TaxID=7936 RepID=A0A0E9Q5I4_ANGAN
MHPRILHCFQLFFFFKKTISGETVFFLLSV